MSIFFVCLHSQQNTCKNWHPGSFAAADEDDYGNVVVVVVLILDYDEDRANLMLDLPVFENRANQRLDLPALDPDNEGKLRRVTSSSPMDCLIWKSQPNCHFSYPVVCSCLCCCRDRYRPTIVVVVASTTWTVF